MPGASPRAWSVPAWHCADNAQVEWRKAGILQVLEYMDLPSS